MVRRLALYALAFLVLCCSGAAAAPSDPFWHLKMERLDGSIHTLAEYEGRPLLVNMWASWCEPCRNEIPSIQRIWREHAGSGLVIVGVDQGEDPAEVREFVREAGISYPVLLDSGSQYVQAVGGGLPTTVVIGRDGKTVNIVTGGLDYDDLEQLVDQVLPPSSPKSKHHNEPPDPSIE
jgi:thiol-disulfide isomerase/thioredoxin